MGTEVISELILRSADGSSILEANEAITAGNIARFRVEAETIDLVSTKLKRLGFKVIQVSPTSLTISGDKGVFEKVFQTTLELQGRERMGLPIRGVEASYYKATKPIQIPEELSSWVTGVAFPTPPEFFP